MLKKKKSARFKKTVLKNGLTVVTERHPAFRSLSMGIWVKIGTRHELPKDAGMSHFLEHMLFKGTESRSALDIAREVDQVGGEFNAFTSREYTCFHILLLDRDADLGLDILGDVLLHSTFSSEELERERKVILQEISMVEESPEELVHDLFFELLYGRHGLGKPILGSVSSIKRLTRADLIKFFQKNYQPDQLILAVAGDVTHEAVLKRIRSFGKRDWHGKPAPKKPVKNGFVPAPKIKSGTWWVERPAEQVHLVWGVQGLSYASKDRFASFLLNVYLGGGMSSSLFQEIREKNGLAYNVYSSLSPFSDSGVFSIYAATSMNQIPLCLRLIEECVERMKKDLLSEDELQMVKDNLKGTILLSADSVESRMTSIAMNEIFFGRYFSVEEVCEQIDAVTPADIRRVARKLLSHGERSILAMGPKPSKQVKAKLKPVMTKY